jgi:hypothetical protein
LVKKGRKGFANRLRLFKMPMCEPGEKSNQTKLLLLLLLLLLFQVKKRKFFPEKIATFRAFFFRDVMTQ